MSQRSSRPKRKHEHALQDQPHAALPAAPTPGRRPSGGWWTWAALLVAAALRLWNVRHGLPDFLDEAIPFRRALMMWGGPDGGIDWNPHFYQYPSLTIYLHLLLQQLTLHAGTWLGFYHGAPDYQVAFRLDPTPMALIARGAQVAADLVTVWMAGRVAERLRRCTGAAVALLVACSPVLIEASRAIYTDTVMTALALAALERMLAWREDGRARTLATSAVLIGLATGAKYPAVVLLLPLAWVLWDRGRWSRSEERRVGKECRL